MKTLYLSKIRFALLSVAAALPVLAQTAGYYRVEFIKTKPGKAAEYREFIKKNTPALTKASAIRGHPLASPEFP